MFKFFKDVKTIRFPVYPLPSRDWYRQDGVLFINDGKVLDDTNMPGESLGVRRLQCGRTDLLNLRRAYPDFLSMLQSKNRVFIDSNGKPFIYVRTINAPLIHHRIKKLTPKDTVTVVQLEKITSFFSIARPPYGDARYARVLYYKGYPWLIYDFVLEKGKDSYRRV